MSQCVQKCGYNALAWRAVWRLYCIMKQRHNNGTISIWIEKAFVLDITKFTYPYILVLPTDLLCTNV